jgi:hypothetical protein
MFLVKKKVNMRIIFFSIVRLLVPYGIIFSVVLSCVGVCLDEKYTLLLEGDFW